MDRPEYGWPGEQIPGSRYVRAYCPSCGAPVRVSPGQAGDPCSVCTRPFRPGAGTPYWTDDPDGNGGWANMVKAHERARGGEY